MKTTYRMALLLGLAAFAAGATEAAAYAEPDEPGIHVMNNYGAMVRVYAEDAEGRLHRLGRVAQGELREFDIPAELAGESFSIKIFPSQPVWAPQQDDFGVRTNPIDPTVDRHVTIWVEPDLARSTVELARG